MCTRTIYIFGWRGESETRLSATLSIISSTSVATFISAINPRQVIKLNDPRSLDHPARKCLFIPTPFKRLRDLPLPRERCVNSESLVPSSFFSCSPPHSRRSTLKTRGTSFVRTYVYLIRRDLASLLGQE